MCDSQGRNGERFIWKGLWWVLSVFSFPCLLVLFPADQIFMWEVIALKKWQMINLKSPKIDVKTCQTSMCADDSILINSFVYNVNIKHFR